MNGISYIDEYLNIGFTPPQLLERWTTRVKIFMELYKQTKLAEKYKLIKPSPCSIDDLLLAHSKEYLKYVKKMGEKGIGYLDYGDTPAYKNVFDKARLACGGTITLAKMIIDEKLKRGFNPQGGFHHAKTDRASGFCVFNDITIAAKLFFINGLKNIAIIDIDGHHGDGTQQILYTEKILKISFHKYDPPWFFPSTGNIYELGKGEGYGYSINIPLPDGAGDDLFIYALENVVIPMLNYYKPRIIIGQMGTDAHIRDPLVGLRLTSLSYKKFADTIAEIISKFSNKRFLGTAGGGYVPETAARMWLLMLHRISGIEYDKDKLEDKEEYTITDNYKVTKFKEKIKELKTKLSEIHGINFS